MAAILDFRSCDIWEHFYVHRWIDHTPKHGIRHQHQLSRLNNTKVMRVFNFGYFGWRPYWIWPKKVPSRFFPPGILIDLVNRPPKENNYVGFKTIPIFSRSNSIFMRLERLYIASPVSLTHLVSIPWWCKDLARVMHVCIGTSVDAAQNIYFPKLNALKSVGLIRFE